MQGYLKFKETDEELYEINLKIESNKKNFITKISYFLFYNYLKLIVQIKKWLHIITVKEIYSGFIFILPFYENESKERWLKKCIPKIKRLMQKYQVSTLVLSDKLKENNSFLEYFQNKRIVQKEVHILDEKEMMPYLIKEIIEYILQKQGKTIELEDLYLIIKQENSEYRENIIFLSQYFKTINIITPCLKWYQKLLNHPENAMVTVTNNKKKSLRKAKWIVNFDMPAEEMKKYTIYQTSTIIYLEKNNVYQGNAFNGLHVCSAGIDVSQEIKDFFIEQHLLNQFSITVLYESTLINKRNLWLIQEQMKKDKVKISKLYGSRGLLEDKEFERVG